MRRGILVLIIGLLAVSAQLVYAQQSFEGHVLSTTDQGSAYFRYFTAGDNRINSPGADSCTGKNYVWDPPYCQALFRATGGYKGFVDDIFNYGGPVDGTVFNVVYDLQQGAGTSGHTGYYFWGAKGVARGESSLWNAVDCVGTTATSCVGQGTTANAAGTDVTNAPTGAIPPLAGSGFRPIPVPLAQVTLPPTGVVNLSWREAAPVGPGGTARYDVYYAISTGTCSAPTDAGFTFLKTVSGLATAVNVTTDLGANSFPISDPKCITFALKIRYPNAGTTEVVSRYLSANGQAVAFGGIATRVYAVVARYVGQNNIEVGWKSSLEDGTQGYYVSRAFTMNGEYTRVSDLIPASGAGAYTFIDTIQAAKKATGVYYRIESLDMDDSVTVTDPVKALLPKPDKKIIKQRAH